MNKLRFFLLVLMFGLVGCAGQQQEENARSLFDRIEFDDDEVGCFRVAGTLDVGGNPFTSTNVAVTLVKKKGDEAPDC